MPDIGIIYELEHLVEDKRQGETSIPLKLLLALAITAKMKVKTSLTDMPFAIEDTELLSEIGYNMVKTEKTEGKGMVSEGEYRFLLGKYDGNEFLSGYNRCVRENILPEAGIACNIHLLDRAKICVNPKNKNYEGGTVVRDDGGAKLGYKPVTPRGIAGDGGVIEEIRFGAVSEHDLNLRRDIILTGPSLKPGDIPICDRGFLSRGLMNGLKTKRGVDVYIPLKKSMNAYDGSVGIAKMPGTKWNNHPNKKRETQK